MTADRLIGLAICDEQLTATRPKGSAPTPAHRLDRQGGIGAKNRADVIEQQRILAQFLWEHPLGESRHKDHIEDAAAGLRDHSVSPGALHAMAQVMACFFWSGASGMTLPIQISFA